MTKTFLVSCALCLAATMTFAQSQQDYLDYIERYKDIAIREMERAGVPASIKLAQAILESNAGRSPLARQANNHFGIKCGPDWKGKSYSQEDDEYDENGKIVKSCFRVYKTAEASFVAHSEFLRDPQKTNRYGFLFMLDPTDYKRWAQGLKRAGYATSATYPERLINLIERFELYRFDKMSTVDLETPANEVVLGVLRINDVTYVVADSSETLADIARRTDVSLRSLLRYNEHLVDDGSKVAEGTVVFLQPKRNSYRGKQTWHYVKEGETMLDISNRYAVDQNKLYVRNRMALGTNPAANERIKLRGCKVKKSETPKLQSQEQRYTPPPANDGFMDTEIEPEPSKNPPSNNQPTTKPNQGGTKPSTTPVEVEPEPTLPVITPQKPPVTPPKDNNNKPTTEPTKPLPTEVTPPVQEDPFGSEIDNKPDTPTNPTPADQPVYHTVVKGDTLWNISQRYKITLDELRRLNNLTNDNIQLGQRLRVK